ncbi:NADP-dependent 3-hydroxy acid dehydrogenase YdfG [Parasphingorhabdus marina DSM 22363]|uniref:NADP-dependent 3-hydroxy acid dehydrogenase YdfG n=1 Tax=Parasphingorhabdus marina DSM 22363 TaxID=1123272 RepID=A0A1N6CTA1_9SPHN|nr:SDR family oxidoreductase [Parasphingorhabdus marina]SIN61743.1 NADP-dependent 3-hydroxy acid dehydrogenase YdfG [Parasphingorhabdus marina DSM 22363]
MAEWTDYRGRTAIVTGAGDGIGKMLAMHLAANGMTVGVQDIREEAAHMVAEEIGPKAFPMVFDISDREATAAAAEHFAAQDQDLAMLWINAGVGVGASLLEGKPEQVRWAWEVNVLGPIWTAQCFVPLMSARPAHVGITASTAALRPPEGQFPLYAATKHGTMVIAEALRGELAARDIESTILCPGLLNTEIWDGAKARPERFGGERRMDPEIAGMWRDAKGPDVMWPDIDRMIRNGGGTLVCATDQGDTRQAMQERIDGIASGLVEL